MNPVVYMIGVFVVLVIWSIIGGVTKRGAQKEIAARGIAGVGSSTIKIARGEATTSDKMGVVISTVLGSLMCPPYIIAAGVLGLVIYVVVRLVS